MAGDYKSFRDFFKSLRKKKRITLREFCIKASADPANISRLELEAMPPLQDTDILERYAKALAIRAEMTTGIPFSILPPPTGE